MANRTYLSCTDAPPRYVELDGKKVSCAASYMVPVFWYMLFDESSLVPASTPCDGDDPDFEYDRLVTARQEGIRLARSRVDALKGLFGEAICEPFDTFVSFLESQPGETLVVETCELAMMDEIPTKYSAEARRCMAAFSQSPIVEKGFFKKKTRVNPNWLALLGQANIESMSESPAVENLCGYSWETPVPWE